MPRKKATGATPRVTLLLFGPAVFLGAFLLFQIQPIVAKHILPWFGGTPAVWTTSLVFFQTVLFAGYAYAYASIRFLPGRGQAAVHAALLLLALLPSVLPGESWAPRGTESPPVRILAMLVTSVGLPYLVLSATSPLAQAWFTSLAPGRSPWRLFALSNAASLLALASYPFVVEPALDVTAQAALWRWLFVAFVAACGALLPAVAKGGGKTAAGTRAAAATAGPCRSTQRPWLWTAFAACGVALFMATTNQLSLNVAAVPFLWVMPLGLYLASFILTFSGPRFYPRRLFAFLLVPAFAVFALSLPGDIQLDSAILRLGVLQKIALTGAALFVCCTACHGELYRARPAAARLTGYYLAISLGGVIGGVLVGVVAPRVFLLHHELLLALLGTAVFFTFAARRDPAGLFSARRVPLFSALAGLGVIAFLGVSWALTALQLRDTVYAHRNFFGLLRVKEAKVTESNRVPFLALYHGSTLHGLQLQDPDRERLPTLYYGPLSGVGLVMTLLDRPGERKVGIVGMGAATLAAYGKAGDYLRFYEIDPDVVRVAKTRFTFLATTEATWDVRVGDARLSLEREPDQHFDLLVLDAFSSDAIPVHLLTREAMKTYARHLAPNGVMAFHISNRHLDLAPIVDGLADANGFRALHVVNGDDPSGTTRAARWILATRDPDLLDRLGSRAQQLPKANLLRFLVGDAEGFRKLRPWTDRYSNLFQILRGRGDE